MAAEARELERFAEQFIASFEAIRRALSLYPASHPTVSSLLQRFLDQIAALRTAAGEAKVSLAHGELFVNGVPLKRLSLTHDKVIASWMDKGIGLIAFDPELDRDSALAFFRAIDQDKDEIQRLGGVDRAVEAAGVKGIQLARVTLGVQSELSEDSQAEMEAARLLHDEEERAATLEQARRRYNEAFGRLLLGIQSAAALDSRVRMVRSLSQLVESRLLERRAVKDLASELRRYDRESYRHALGGAVVSVLIGAALGLEPRHLRLLGEAALLRDMGKVEVPLEILHQRDRDAETRKAYEYHTILGARLLLERWEIDATAAIVAYEHHARLDLNGFPRLGAKKSIHPFSRIVAVASDYDRLTGGYPGTEVTTMWEAVQTLIRGVGSIYDPAAMRGFLRLVGCFPEGTPVKLVDGRQGVVAGIGQRSWQRPRVAVLRGPGGEEVESRIIETDDLAAPGEPVVEGFLYVTERDLERLMVLV